MSRRCVRNSSRTALSQLHPGPKPHTLRTVRRALSTTSPPQRTIDPFALVAPHLTALRTSLLPLLASAHPSITSITKYYFLHPSKQIRPVILVLLAQATNGLGAGWARKRGEAERGGRGVLDRPMTRRDVMNDYNPLMPDETSMVGRTWSMNASVQSGVGITKGGGGEEEDGGAASSSSPSKGQHLPDAPQAETSSTPQLAHTLLPTQERLAQIVEMLHTSSLLHDDVIDVSPLRRGAPSAPSAFGNKLSVLGGNFILGRASTALARLGEPEVTQLIASVISNLVEGEILQMKDVKLQSQAAGSTIDALPAEDDVTGQTSQDAWNIYLQKTYLKTASLMAKGARAVVILGGCEEGEPWKEIAYAYGRNLGIAFQLVDDVLDYESASSTLGKPGGADLSLGLATGPALYAWEEYPEMGTLIGRKFKEKGDVEMARDLVLRSSGVQRTRQLAQAYADKAREVLQELPASDAKEGLEALTEKVIGRKS